MILAVPTAVPVQTEARAEMPAGKSLKDVLVQHGSLLIELALQARKEPTALMGQSGEGKDQTQGYAPSTLDALLLLL
jgi:hypothetical protein